MEQTKKAGLYSWNELMTSDVAGAKKFYGELLGWELVDTPMCDMGYTLVKVDGQDIAGIMATPEEAKGMPPMWGGYVTVDDVDAVVERVVGLGGKVCVDPQDIPDVGRFTVIQDPQGAMLSLITYTC